jgi:alpha-1,4-digalacturonate transport system substrate-binding protein
VGASFFDADGNWTIDSEGFRSFAEIIKGWHDKGITPKEVWLGSGGSYAQAGDYFVNAELVMYMSGNWNIGRFTNDIGDAFDWDVVPNPTGPGGSTGLPGGASIAAFKSTEYPEEVARVMEYLIQEDVVAEFAARTLFIPGQLTVAGKGVDYATDLPAARSALNGYLSEVPKLQDQAFQLFYNPVARVYYTESVNRLTQWILGELSLDEAIARVQQSLDEAIANR